MFVSVSVIASSRCLGSMRQFCQEAPQAHVRAVARCNLQTDPECNDSVKMKGKYKKRPGKRVTTPIKPPERLVKAAYQIVQNSNLATQDLIKEAESFRNHMIRRMLPSTPNEVREKTQEIQEQIAAKDGIDTSLLTEEGKARVEQSRNDQIESKLKTMIYNWKPTDYNDHNCLLYLLGMFSPNYATLCKIFSEIKLSAPDFKPTTFLDFGSGVGSGIWAAQECFEGSVSEAMCVDASSEMNDIAQLLLQDGDPNADPWMKNIFFKRFLPQSNLIKYDLVLCAHSLMDTLTSRERIQTINSLWNKTQDMLVIVEHGSYAGHTIVTEAREYIRNTFNEDPGRNAFHVVAPCQHDFQCPKLLTLDKRPCSFPAKFHPLSFHREKDAEMEKYSYIVFSKRKHREKSEWPRIISPVLKRSRHVICRICTSEGKLHESVVTKWKDGSHLYRIAKHCKWGDLMPVRVGAQESTADSEYETYSSGTDNESDSDSDSETASAKGPSLQ